MVLGVMIYWIELKGVRAWWTRFFDVFGKNPLFIFVLSGVWVKLYALARIPDGIREEKEVFINAYGWLYKYVFQAILGDYPGSLAFAIAHVVIFWLIGRILDQKKIYVRV